MELQFNKELNTCKSYGHGWSIKKSTIDGTNQGQGQIALSFVFWWGCGMGNTDGS